MLHSIQNQDRKERMIGMKQEFYFPSKNGSSRIHAVKWESKGEARAALQIVHGMAEHIERYDEFARYLCSRGIVVVGHSHLGHGKSAVSEEELGFFHEPNGNACVVADIHALREGMEDQYPGVPYFLLGHSMGSFLVRQYIHDHADGLSGAVIMGTGDQPVLVLRAAKLLCRLIASWKGWRHRSDFINGFVCGGFEKKLGLAWLSKNEENVRRYAEDQRCGFVFTLNGFYHMFSGMLKANIHERAGQIPKSLPLLFTSGLEDLVGNNGHGVAAVWIRYRKFGAQKAELRLYPGDRHEILNELDREGVFADLYDWIERNL